MDIYTQDDYYYLVHNGCYPDGYVEGLGFVSSRMLTIRKKHPCPLFRWMPRR
jgi:hypothetical protein